MVIHYMKSFKLNVISPFLGPYNAYGKGIGGFRRFLIKILLEEAVTFLASLKVLL